MKIESFSKTILRTSAYSYDSVLKILNSSDDSWLYDLLKDDYFTMSLSLASPELLKEALRIKELDKESKEYNKIKRSLLKYVIRMGTRCTPFGLFSGVGIVSIADLEEKEGIEVLEKKDNYKHFRLDMNFSVQLVNEISKNETIINLCKFYPNTSLYSLGNFFRLVTYSIFNKARSYDLISVEKNYYLDTIIEEAKYGVTKKELVESLVNKEIERSEAEEYVSELIDSQVVVNELEPTTIGLEIEFQLQEKLIELKYRCTDESQREIVGQLINYLTKIIQKLEKLDSTQLDRLLYEELIDFIINQNPIEISDIDKKFLIQCNVAIKTTSESSISTKQVGLVSKAIDILNHFQSKQNSQTDTFLGKFKKAFQMRYEDRFVPLVEALDVETGIGYGIRQESDSIDHTPFIMGVPAKYEAVEFEELKWNANFHSFWLKKFQKANKNSKLIVELTDEELKGFKKREVKYSPTFIAKTNFFKDDKNEDILNFEFYGGTTASLWYGRFCNSNKDLENFNQEFIDYEAQQDKEVIIAEINHLPESRLGNVIHRSQSREYQINYLAGNNTKKNSHLEISDLYIGIRQDKLVLISKKLKKIVRTYHSNAFNSEMPSNLPIFQFLADLENEYYTAKGSLNLGTFHRYLKFLPRIQYKNIIFQRASWTFQLKDFDSLMKIKEGELINAFKQFREKWLLSEQFVIKAGDNELLVHSNNIDSVQILLSEVKRHSQVQLSEFLPSKYESIVKDSLGNRYNNELLFNYKMNNLEQKSFNDIENVLKTETKEIFSPGSEWVYYKLYMGIKTSNKFLEAVNNVLEELKDDKIVVKWFFIRYGDPKLHLRLRLKLTNQKFLGDVMSKMYAFFNEFQTSFPIERILLDSYQRELERYGYDLMPDFETIFYHDSKMTIELINHCKSFDKMDYLWLSTLYSMYTYCKLFQFSNEEMEQFIEWNNNAFRDEFKAYSETTKELNKKYNSYKKEIVSIFIEEDYSNFNSFIHIVENRNQAIQPLINKIGEQYPSANQKMNYLSSIIHMSVNRQFRTSQRMYEFMLYDFLKKITNTMKYVKPKIKSQIL